MTNNKPNDVRVVPVQLLEEFRNFLDEAYDGGLEGVLQEDAGNMLSYIVELLAQPADQQGEPVAWLNEATGDVTTCTVVVMDWDDEKEPVKSLYAQPSTAKVDERVEFEKFASSIGRDVGRYDDGEYGCIDTSADWMVWQARAKLNGDAKMDEREAFEAVFPMPGSVMKLMGTYVSNSLVGWGAHEYRKKWAAWKARANLNAAQ